MARIQQGTIGPRSLTYTGRSRSFTASGGAQTSEMYVGDVGDVDDEYDLQIAAGQDATTEPMEGGKARLAIHYSDGSGTVGTGDPDALVYPVWSLSVSPEKASCLKFADVKALIFAMGSVAYPQFASELAQARAGNTDYFSGTFIPYTGSSVPLNGALYQILAGNEMVDFFWAVLRKTRTCPRNTALVTDWSDVLKIWTTTQLTTAETTIPAAIGTLPTGDWLKLPGTKEDMGDGRIQISTEFHYRETGGWDERLESGGYRLRGTYARKT